METEIAFKVPAIPRTKNGRRNPRGKVAYETAKGIPFEMEIGGETMLFAIQYGWNADSSDWTNPEYLTVITHVATGYKVSEFRNAYLMECVGMGETVEPVPVAKRLVGGILDRVGVDRFRSVVAAVPVLNPA